MQDVTTRSRSSNMKTSTILLLCILIGANPVLGATPSDFYSGFGGKAASTSDFYSGFGAKQEEKPNEKPNDKPPEITTRTVVIYSDHSCVECYEGLREDTDRIQGVEIRHQDKDKVPEQWRKRDLPLAHFYGEDGHWHIVTYGIAEDFKTDWLRHNPNGGASSTGTAGSSTAARLSPDTRANPRASGGTPKGSRANENDRSSPSLTNKGQGKVRSQEKRQGQVQVRSQRAGCYLARSYEWHLTRGESRSALISHLSVPRREHHGASFERSWLSTLSFTELVGLHSDAHNGRVQWQYVGRSTAAAQKPRTDYSMTFAYGVKRRSADCPHCPK